MVLANVYNKDVDNNKAMTREELIDLIENRIKSEYKKHGDLDWSRIAACKICGNVCEDESIYSVLLDLIKGNGLEETFMVLHNIASDLGVRDLLESQFEEAKTWTWV